jgi:[FeFe] hydrogenase H-cluster maturation GTPase HydF
VVAFNKVDVAGPSEELRARLEGQGLVVVATDGRSGQGLSALRASLLAAAPVELRESPTLLADLVGPGELAVLVVPVDKEAPKGRLILPQAQAIRELLDHDAYSLVVKEHQLATALARLRVPPKLVVTDSQAFREVAAIVPPEVPLTGFSVLMARVRGDLVAQTRGALAIDHLRPGDRVLMAEACTHHPIGEDIGRVKIPRWLAERAGGPMQIETVQGHDFPADLSPYGLIILCGACMLGRREVRARLAQAERAGIPMTNYGLAIAHCFGILERALGPFPAAQALLHASPCAA